MIRQVSLNAPKELLRAAMTLGRQQQFLGASWVEPVLKAVPPSHRYAAARRLVSLSPHYVYVTSKYGGAKLWPSASEIEAELERNRYSRRVLARDLLDSSVSPQSVVLDYGCGPGFAAAPVAERARLVYAADIAPAILRIAQILNGRSNVEYVLVERGTLTGLADGTVDVAYSFAVLQHLTDDAAHQALREIARVTRPGGILVMHVVIDDPEWRSEEEWFADSSPTGRVRARIALQCFRRGRDQIEQLVSEGGFGGIGIVEASSVTDVADDIKSQHILTATRSPVP